MFRWCSGSDRKLKNCFQRDTVETTPDEYRKLAMSKCDGAKNGYDVVIVCCSTEQQADFWGARLKSVRGSLLPLECEVMAVFEDWADGGAGNGLGTLYAYQKACKQNEEYNLEDKLLKGEVSVGLFHTAGKGTRLAPLPGSENNNKPGVKLPGVIGEGNDNLTILEAVVKQTGMYASSRKGRLSVFWGDQVFIPSVGVHYTPRHHVDILAKMGPMPAPEQWAAEGLEKYGLICVNDEENAAQVEKVTHSQASALLEKLGNFNKVGTSLGSFSVSAAILTCLMAEFKPELEKKEGKLDTDPHFWMPMTLDRDGYQSLMSGKGVTEEDSSKHFDRIADMMEKFKADEAAAADTCGPPLATFGAVDVGTEAYWWDYGQLRWYIKYNKLVLEDSVEAEALREFLQITSNQTLCDGTIKPDVTVEGRSHLVASSVNSGKVVSSLLSNVQVDSLDVEDCILINCTAKSIKGKGCIVYNVVDDSEDGITLEDGAVLTGVITPGADEPQSLMHSTTATDGGDAWKKVVAGNSKSFEKVYKDNSTTDIQAVAVLSAKMHAAAWSKINPKVEEAVSGEAVEEEKQEQAEVEKA